MDRKRSIFPILCLLLVLILSGCGGEKALPGDLTVAGIQIGGMKAGEAKEALDAVYSEPISIRLGTHTLTLSPEESGAALDTEALLSRVEAGGDFSWTDFLTLDNDAIRAAVKAFCEEINTEPEQPQCRIEAEALTITTGIPGWHAEEDAIYELVLQAYHSGNYTIDWTPGEILPEEPDLSFLLDQVYVAPVNAVMDPDTYAITPGADGYGFDMDAAAELLRSAEPGETLTIPLGPIAPEITEQTLLEEAFPDTLGAWQSDCTDSEDRTTNLRLACEAINGKILFPGDVFSYNETLGRRTAEKGYRPAPAYVGNKTVYTLGGGICQVSSALYYCTLIADLEIVYRTYHSYMQTYVPIGMDATVSWGTLDYKFRNNTEHPIRIVASVYDDQVHVELRGTDGKDYYVKMEYEVLSSTPYTVLYETYPPDNSQGYTNGQVLVEPYAGCQAKTYKCKYDKETGELLSREYEAYSNYHKRDAVVCQIAGEEDITGKVTFAGSEG